MAALFGEETEAIRRLRGEFHFLFQLARRVADKSHFEFFASLSTSGIDSGRPRKGTDVQTIWGIGRTAIGRVAHFDGVNGFLRRLRIGFVSLLLPTFLKMSPTTSAISPAALISISRSLSMAF